MSKRLMRDLAAIKADNEWHFTAQLDDSDLTKLTATFPGPAGSPYEGGVFVVDFKVPPEYPLKPPSAKFRTRVFHPNISSQTGAICLDILKSEWTPVYNLQSILISLQQLLSSPNPADPQDAEVAGVFTNHPDEYVKTAREWTQKYATPLSAPGIDESTLTPFIEMGYPREKVLAVLHDLGIKNISTDDDKTRVAEALLGH